MKEKDPADLGAIKRYLKNKKFTKLSQEEIIQVNLVETKNDAISGISELFKKISDFSKEKNIELFKDDNIKNKINDLLERLNNNNNSINTEFKKEVNDLYITLNKSEIFKGFKNYEDIIKKGYIKSSLLSTFFSLGALG